jgi:hypothetical protein
MKGVRFALAESSLESDEDFSSSLSDKVESEKKSRSREEDQGMFDLL